MQRLKRAIKKMAAISTGIAMLGATMTSALALDLADYPAPYVDANGVFDESTAIVVGANAAASDTLGAVDIATNIQFMAKTPVASASGTVTVAGGKTEDVPIAKGISDTNVGLDWQLDDSEISSFIDTSITFQSKSYNIHDELVFDTADPLPMTSLTSADDDYETSIVLETTARDKIKYYYVFDEALNVSKSTSSEPLEIKFLGKTVKITNVDTNQQKFTAYVGAEYFMHVGDTVTVDGKKITLQNVGSSDAIVVDVDGTIETIPSGNTETVNGIEISNDEAFYEDTKSERAASLVIGQDAKETYADGDAFVGEDDNDPNWVWDIASLGANAATSVTSVSAVTGPKLGIENDFVQDDDSDNPPQVGDCIDLPNDYASICFDSLTVADDNYATYTIEYDANSDLSEAHSSLVSVPTIYIHTSVSEGLVVDSDATNMVRNASVSIAPKTNKIWLFPGHPATMSAARDFSGVWKGLNNSMGVFYENTDGKTRLAGVISGDLDAIFAQVNFDDTTGTSNINFNITRMGNPQANFSWLVVSAGGDVSNELAAGGDFLRLEIAQTATGGNFSGLGNTSADAEATELRWGSQGYSTVSIGTKDEDHRTAYGIIVRDPKNHLGSDEVVLDIPGDQVQTNIVVKGTSATVSGGSTSYIPADISVQTKLDSEVADPTAYQLILVGGPCANSVVEDVFNLACSAWELASGEALLKLVANGGKVALLVAGTDAIDTRMAAKVIANYGDYKLETTEQVVTGTLSAPTIKVS